MAHAANTSYAIKVNNLNNPQIVAKLGAAISAMPQTASIIPGKNGAPYAFINVTGSIKDANSVWKRLNDLDFSVAPRAWLENDHSSSSSTALVRKQDHHHRQGNQQVIQSSGSGLGVELLASALAQLGIGNMNGVKLNAGNPAQIQLKLGQSVQKSSDGSSSSASFSLDLSIVYGKHAGVTKFDKHIKRDSFGNVDGPEYDLSPDGTFQGQTISILQLYTHASFNFASPKAALQRKGFTVHIWNSIPPVDQFEAQLKKSCQLWVISGSSVSLTPQHIAVVQKLVDLNKGLFIWADNDPYTADANALLSGLTQTNELSIRGNYMADKVLKEADATPNPKNPNHLKHGIGFTPHLITTGIESLYEGITISSVSGSTKQYRPLIRSSDGNVVTCCHDRDNTRIVIDGGFTRLFEDRWARTAGTARFVTNAACWLFNFEGRPQARAIHARAASAASASDGDEKQPYFQHHHPQHQPVAAVSSHHHDQQHFRRNDHHHQPGSKQHHQARHHNQQQSKPKVDNRN